MPAIGIFSSIFLEKAFFNRNLGKISLLGNFCSDLSILVNISVSNHSIQGYLAVIGLKHDRCDVGPTEQSYAKLVMCNMFFC